VWFFFASKLSLYQQFAEFFEYNEQTKQPDSEGMDDSPKMDKANATIRYYFNLTYNLAKEDITKMEQIDEINVYLCLSTLSLMKERYEKEMEEYRKMEKQIKITAKLYECRDTAKSLAKMKGEDYKEMLKPYSDIITKVMKANNLKHIPALLKISETKTYQDSGMAQMLFMAALTELMEPSA